MSRALLRREQAISFVKEEFSKGLQKELNIIPVSGPLVVLDGTGINDDLNSIERPVKFPIKSLNDKNAVVVHSLAKWKRIRLKELEIEPGEGIITDMRALRPDEDYSPIHSIYVDQWDWEKIITKDQRKQLFSPYQLVNYKGTWHLVGVSEGRLQAYPLSNITLVELSQQTFTRDAYIQRQIDTDPTLWRSGMIEVLLKASAAIAINFQHRPLLPEQEIVKTLDDGALLLSSRVLDANQILPVIKSWMPGLTVISPGFIHEQIVRDLRHLLTLMSQAPP